MLTLYDIPYSGNSYKVRLLLSHLNLPCERVPVDILKGETRTPAFYEKNVLGRAPVLVFEDGRCLPESNAILFYLAQGTPFLPDDAFTQAQVLGWLFFEQNLHEPNIATLRFLLNHMPEKLTPDVQEDKHRRGMAALADMARHLSSNDFFAADAFTIADIALYAYTHVAHEGGFDLGAFPAIEHWLSRVEEQPGHIPITA